jgi:hypothetical protein
LIPHRKRKTMPTYLPQKRRRFEIFFKKHVSSPLKIRQTGEVAGKCILRFSIRSYLIAVISAASLAPLYKDWRLGDSHLSFLSCWPLGRAGGFLSLVNNPVELWPYKKPYSARSRNAPLPFGSTPLTAAESYKPRGGLNESRGPIFLGPSPPRRSWRKQATKAGHKDIQRRPSPVHLSILRTPP